MYTRKKNLFICLLIRVFQGVPFPQNEANAMDVVIQFAVHKLGFQLSDIVVYAWSIGGFTGRKILEGKKTIKSIRLPATLVGTLVPCYVLLISSCPVWVNLYPW